MFCRKCGKELEKDDMFCGGCGAPVRRSEEKKDDEPKIISTEQVRESSTSEPKEDLVSFLSNEKPKITEEKESPKEEPENDLVSFLMSEKTNSDQEEKEENSHKSVSSLDFDDPKNNLVDLVINEKPKDHRESTDSFDQELVKFTEPKKEQDKSKNQFIGIGIGIVCFIAAFLLVTFLLNGKLFNREKLDPDMTDISKFDETRIGRLLVAIPPKYTVTDQQSLATGAYKIFSNEKGTCGISLMRADLNVHESIEKLIDASLIGGRDAVYGTMSPYSISPVNINAKTWSTANTVIKAQNTEVSVTIYAIKESDCYYGITFQSQKGTSCEASFDLSAQSLRFG